MRAERHYRQGQVALAIPLGVIITAKVALKNEHIQLMGVRLVATSGTVTVLEVLIAWLILEKRLNENSQWKAYLNILPEQYSLPCQWADSELVGLPDHCINMVRQERLKIDKIMEVLNNALVDIYEPTRAEYYWAYSTVKTRNVHVGDARYLEKTQSDWSLPEWVESSSYDSSCLVPYFDMLNNEPSVCNSYTYNRREEQFEIKCGAEIASGAQIFINYGSYGMLDILLDYGYVHDTTDLEVPVTGAEIGEVKNDEKIPLEKHYIIYEHCIDSQLIALLDSIDMSPATLLTHLLRKYEKRQSPVNDKIVALLLRHLSQIK